MVLSQYCQQSVLVLVLDFAEIDLKEKKRAARIVFMENRNMSLFLQNV